MRPVFIHHLIAGIAIITVALAGCDSNDGATGEAGPPGEPGTNIPIPVTAGPQEALNIEITDVTVDGAPVVEFTVTNQDGLRFVGLAAGQPNFTIAKLVPGTDGDSDHWQNYLNRLEQPDVGPGTEDQIQATTENNGTLEDHEDGTYTYTFATDITDVTTPLAVSYDSTLTHRLGIELRGGLPPANATYTFRPSNGMTAGINDRTVVETGSCNTCHGRLELHGGARLDTGMCVLCHNPGSADANSGNTLDFSVMIHKLHAGEELPSVAAGGTYSIYGYNDTLHDYSDVVFPRDIRSCTVCHDPANTATPEAVNITASPSIEACGACHDDVDFASGPPAPGHPGGVVTDNSECTTCHAADRVAGEVLADHAISTIVEGERFQFNLLGVTQTAPGQIPQVVLSVTDPTNGDAPYNILTAPEFTGASMTARFSWDTDNNSNWPGGLTTGNVPAMPRNVNVLTTAVNNGDGTFTVNAPTAVPAAGVAGSGVVTLEGRARVNAENIPITGAVRYFAITDAQPVPRRQVVSVEKCQVCHGERDRLAFHGGGRTDNVELCVVCHNPNVTDINRRPADPMTTADGRVEQSAHFKYMIHSIHGAAQRDADKPYVVWGFGNPTPTEHDFSDVRYPRPSSDCAACHVDGSIDLPLASSGLATTISTGADRYDPVDDLNITATAAACGSCHNDDLAEAHMLQNGALFDQTQGTIDSSTVETCAVCHGPGSLADVEVMHAD